MGNTHLSSVICRDDSARCGVFSRHTAHFKTQLWPNDSGKHTRRVLRHGVNSRVSVIVWYRCDGLRTALTWLITQVLCFRRMQRRLREAENVTPAAGVHARLSARRTDTSQWRCHNCSCGKNSYSSRDVALQLGLSQQVHIHWHSQPAATYVVFSLTWYFSCGVVWTLKFMRHVLLSSLTSSSELRHVLPSSLTSSSELRHVLPSSLTSSSELRHVLPSSLTSSSELGSVLKPSSTDWPGRKLECRGGDGGHLNNVILKRRLSLLICH